MWQVEKFFRSDKIRNMKTKPLIFTIILILCLIEPLIKVLYFKITTQFDFSTIMINLFARHTFRDVFDFWLVYPITGLLLLKLRKWTYFAFMSFLIYIVYNIFTYEKYTWPYNSDSPFWYNYFVVTSSVMVFFVFLLPAIREPFFDKRLRWWEPQTRYLVGINCSLKNDSLIFPSEIINISASGAFLKDSSYFRVGDKLDLDFRFLGKEITLPVVVVHRHSKFGRNGYGVKFCLNSFRQNIVLSKVMRVVRETNRPV